MNLTDEIWKGTVPPVETLHDKRSDLHSVNGWGLTWGHKSNTTVTERATIWFCWRPVSRKFHLDIDICSTVALCHQHASKGPTGPWARLKSKGGHVLSLWLWNCFPLHNIICRHIFMSACIQMIDCLCKESDICSWMLLYRKLNKSYLHYKFWLVLVPKVLIIDYNWVLCSSTQTDSPIWQNTCVVSVSFAVMRTVALHKIGSWRNIRIDGKD